MSSLTDLRAPDLAASIGREGFAFVHGDAMRALLLGVGDVHGLGVVRGELERAWRSTRYMADGGRYRRRRHAVFAAAPGQPIERQPHQPHFQTLDYNPLNGGIARWFEPIARRGRRRPTLQTDPRVLPSLFGNARRPARSVADRSPSVPDRSARTGEAGRPTPEGLHRDGVDYVLVLLVNRRNIASGMTTIHALDGRPLGHFTLTEPFDAALVDDTPRRARRHAGRSDRPGAAGVSRRAGRDVPEGLERRT